MLGISSFVAINSALISFLLVLGHHFNFYCFSCPINALRCSSKEPVQIAKQRRMTMTWPLALPWNSSFSVIPWKCSSFFTALETWLKQGCQHMFLRVRNYSDSGACEEPVSYHSARNTPALAPLLSNSVRVRLSKRSWQVSGKTIAALALICMPSIEILCH